MKLVIIPRHLFLGLDNLMVKIWSKDRYISDSTTLGRHLNRSGYLCRIIGDEIQRIVRLSDLFAKTIVVNKTLQLRATIQEVLAHSRKRQRRSYRKERKNPDSPWYRKTKSDLNIYLQNEESVLNRAVEWLSSLGISFEDLMSDTNWRKRDDIGSTWKCTTIDF